MPLPYLENSEHSPSWCSWKLLSRST